MHAVSGHTSLHRRMQALVAAAQAESTRTGYASDLRHYRPQALQARLVHRNPSYR